MQDRHTNREQYFRELATTCEKYYIPYIEQILPDLSKLKILEIGCGDGGNLLPFLQRGCKVTAIDISSARIVQASILLNRAGYSPRLIANNVFNLTKEELGTFDLILMHDVIEHIGDKCKLLNKVTEWIAPNGLLYIAFPAWQMPFGGHQQICRNHYLSKLPFIHLLPESLYSWILNKGGEEKEVIDELIDIKRCKLPIEKFERIIQCTSLTILQRNLYFINPHYEIKFHLKPRPLPALIAKIPYIRNFFTTSCFYLIQKKHDDSCK